MDKSTEILNSLCLEGKISSEHAQEITTTLTKTLRDVWEEGYSKGKISATQERWKLHHKLCEVFGVSGEIDEKTVDEIVRKYKERV